MKSFLIFVVFFASVALAAVPFDVPKASPALGEAIHLFSLNKITNLKNYY